MRATRISACLIALAMLLSGCVSIPRDGGIGRIDVSDSDAGVQSRIDPDGPVPGAGPDEIVRGFLAAGAGYSNNFEVARSFLTESFADDWDPLAAVQVMPAGTGLDEITSEITADSQHVSLDVPVQANLDERRIYREPAGDTVVEMDFTLQQVNGEWRISQAQPGIVVSASNFNTLFQAYPLYFYSPDYDFLVPDTRWFIRSPATATVALSALLRGPAEHLTGAVVSAVPEGTQLEPRAVTVNDGRARVGLSETAEGLDERTQARLVTQLTQTLQEVGSVTDVDVGVPSGDLDPEATVDAQKTADIDPRPVAISGSALVRVVGTGVEPIPGSPELTPEDTDPAIALDESMYAYLGADGAELRRVIADTMTDVSLLAGEDLVGPGFDRFGWTWSAEAESGGRLLAVDRSGQLVEVAVPFLADRRIEALHVARNGTQLGVLSTDADSRTHLEVIGLMRDRQDRPTGTVAAAPLAVGTGFDSIADFSWAGEQSVVMLATPDPATPVMPYSSLVTGPVETLGAIDGGYRITAGNDPRSLYVSTAAGELFTYGAGNWQNLVGVRVYDPAYPG